MVGGITWRENSQVEQENTGIEGAGIRKDLVAHHNHIMVISTSTTSIYRERSGKVTLPVDPR